MAIAGIEHRVQHPLDERRVAEPFTDDQIDLLIQFQLVRPLM